MSTSIPSSSSPTNPVKKGGGGFLPDTFFDQVDEFLENTESEYEDEGDEESQTEDAAIDDNRSTPPPLSLPTRVVMTAEEASSARTSANEASKSRQSRRQSGGGKEASLSARTAVQKTKNPSRASSLPKKSALKKVSSYTGLEGLELDGGSGDAAGAVDEIPINTNKSAWITLPAPRHTPKTTVGSTGVRRVGSSPALFPEQQPCDNRMDSDALSTQQQQQQPRSRRIKRNVSFTEIHVRDYPMTLGDNPSTLGTPVALDWTYQQQTTVAVEDWENTRRRRSRYEMRLPESTRHDILRAAGISTGEMLQTTKQTAKTRRQRAATLTLLPLAPIEVLVESATRKMKRLRAGLSSSGHKKTRNHSASSSTIKRSRSANALWHDDDSGRP